MLKDFTLFPLFLLYSNFLYHSPYIYFIRHLLDVLSTCIQSKVSASEVNHRKGTQKPITKNQESFGRTVLKDMSKYQVRTYFSVQISQISGNEFLMQPVLE